MRLPVAWHPPADLRAPATVSVVIPCYNYARYLPDAVGSALSQSLVLVNVIVVDDASTDDSLRVARSLADQDGRVAVLANHQNLGPVGTFNRGLAQATGEFVVRLDADDLLTPGSLSRAVALMQEHPSVGLVYGHPIHFTGDAPPPARSDVDGWLIWKGLDWLEARCADGTNVITSPEVVMRRGVVDVVGGQRPLKHTHDMEMWLRIAAHADVAYILGADQAWHREHPSSLSRGAEDPFVILSELRAAFEVLFSGIGSLTAAHQDARSQARRAVAVAALDHAQSLIDNGTASDVCGRLQEFAIETDPTVSGTPEWERVARAAHSGRGRGPLAKVRGVLPRARRRVRHQRRHQRWARTGVYESLSITPVRGKQ